MVLLYVEIYENTYAWKELKKKKCFPLYQTDKQTVV